MDKWVEIADNFSDGLVLGNGASIAFDKGFGYTTLLERAGQAKLIRPDVRRVFEHFDTVDFELVLRMLWHANQINQALSITEPRTAGAYRNVREALVGVVRDIHAGYDEVADRLLPTATFMSRFKTVASLNYDVLVYWAMLVGNEADQVHAFKDCFVDSGHRFRHDWVSMRENISPATSSTIVAYPHGNLALAVDIFGDECKLVADHGALLDKIFEEWASDQYTPVFVCEGTSEQKLAAIRRSPYLFTVYDEILPSMTESVVLFGWSLGEHDVHILNSLCSGGVTRFAIALNPESADVEDDERRITRLLNKRVESPDITFFDRSSSGCWLSP